MYIIDRFEHGNGGVCGHKIIFTGTVAECLKKDPFKLGVTSKMFGFWPIISGTDDINNISYYWDEDENKWYKDHKKRKPRP